MSAFAPNWYVEQWKDGVIHVFQSRGFTLKNVTTPPVKVTAEKLHFLIAGRGEAENNVQRGDVAMPMNAPRNRVTLDHSKDRAFDEVYEDDLDQMTVDEMQVVQETSAMALGRTQDRKIINALNAEAGNQIGAYNATAGLLELIKGKQKLMSLTVPVGDGQLFWAVDSVTWANLTTFEKFVSSDYVGPELPYVNGQLAKTWNGVHVFNVDDELLPINGTEADTLMWHRSAIGFGFVRELTGTVQWDNRKDCWTHNMRMRNGAKVLLPDGVLRIRSEYDPDNITLT